jgi:hypothetical protein
MLKSLRKIHKYIIWAVVACFLLWGIQGVGTYFAKKGRIAGTVFGKEVSFQEYNRFYKAAQIFSPGGIEDRQDEEKLREQAWQNIILSREARRRRIDVDDREVRGQILRILDESNIPDPSPEVYRRWLRTFRETPVEFEKKIREYLRIQKLTQGINEEPVLAPTDGQIRDRYQLENSTIGLSIAKFPSYEEALAFKTNVISPRDWERTAAALDAGQIQVIPKESFDGLIKTWDIPDFVASRLFSLEPGTVSDPFPVPNAVAVALIAEKVPADDSRLTDELREKYRRELTELAQFQRFMIWNMKLREEADLKDYLPRSPDEENPPPPEPNF